MKMVRRIVSFYIKYSELVFWTGLAIVWWPTENVKKKMNK